MNLALTSDAIDSIGNSGQCFRWHHDAEKSWNVSALGENVFLSETPDGIVLTHQSGRKAKTNEWERYFDIGYPYEESIEEMHELKNPNLDAAIAFSPGMRILRQDLFEACISFLISQNSNIPKIRHSIEKLCGGLGKEFPDAENILAILSLDDCGLGYRKEFVEGFCCLWSAGKLEDLGSSYLEDYNRLISIRGIGPKVANCILLYGLHYMEAYPVDVWMARASKLKIPVIPHIAGLEQQYVFAWMRAGCPF